MENLDQIEQQRFERATKRVKAISGFYRHFIVYLLVNIFFLTLKYFKLGPNQEFWNTGNFSMAIWWGLGVAFHAIGVFGPGLFLGSNWEERKIRQIMEKEKNNKWE